MIGSVLTTVPITRLDQADPDLLEKLLAVVGRVASNGAFTMGAELEAFEAEFAAYCEIDHAVGVSSGTEALVLAGRVPESEFERMRGPAMGGAFPFPVKYGYAMVGVRSTNRRSRKVRDVTAAAFAIMRDAAAFVTSWYRSTREFCHQSVA